MSQALSRNDHHGWGPVRYLFAGLTLAGFGLWLAAAFGYQLGQGWMAFLACYGLITVGSLGWVFDIYRGSTPGIKNHGLIFTIKNYLRNSSSSSSSSISFKASAIAKAS